MVLWWVGMLGWAGEDPLPHPLDQEAFRFCHVPGANAEQALAWCDLLDEEARARCPGLVETCDDRVVSEDPRGCEPPTALGGDADALAGEPEPPPNRILPEQWSCDGPETGGASLLRWVAAIGVGVLVLVVLRLIWSTLGSMQARRPAAPPAIATTAPIDEAIPDGPSDDLLDAARAAHAIGRYGEAVLLARGAALRRLGEAGKLLLHRSRTDREYTRRLAGDPGLREELRRIVSFAERVRFGGRAVDAGAAGSAIAAAERILGALVGAGLLLMLLIAAPARAQDYESYGPSGDAALLPLLRQYGYDPGWRLRSLLDLDETTDALVLQLANVRPTDEQWDKVREWVAAGGVLIVAGDASGALPELGQYEIATADGSHVVAGPFAAAGLPSPRYPLPPAYWSGGSARTLVGFFQGDQAFGSSVALLDLGDGVVVALADPALLYNAAFVHPDNERFVGELVYLGQALEGWPVEVPARIQLATTAATRSEDSQSQGCQTPLAALAQAGLLVLLGQLMFSYTIAAVRRGWPFAPLRDPPDEGRQQFSEHVVALGTRYWLRGDSGWALHQHAALWLGRLGRSGLELAAQRAGYTPADARAWAERIEAAAQGSEGGQAPLEPPSRGAEGREALRTPRAPAPSAPDDLQRMEELWRVTRKEQR